MSSVKDVNGDRSGNVEQRLAVPELHDDRLSSSSLIVADNVDGFHQRDRHRAAS